MKTAYKIALFLIFILLNILDNAYSQESWVINDEDFNSLFIEAYNEALFELMRMHLRKI